MTATLVLVFVLVVDVWTTGYWRKRYREHAFKSLDLAQRWRNHAADLSRLIESGIVTRAMLDGHRPVVTEAPAGMTKAEAQAMVDRIWADLQFDAMPGVGGRRN